jgi:predicted ATPase
MVTQFGTYFQKAKSELKSEIALEFLNIVYTNKNGLDTIKTPTKELYLQEAASGYQSIIPLYLVMKYFAEQSGEKTIIIEEPELNLYPKTQNELVRVLTSLANKNNNNLVVTTHSPYILTSLNNLLFANQIFEKDSLKTKDISKILPKESWIVANNFSAYHIEKGKSKSIFDRKTQLIVETQLDSASEVINTDFDCLMNIYKNL